MKSDNDITRVTVRWDDQSGCEAGWYCETWVGREMIDDSQKVWFPVAVDSFGRDEADELEESLREAFPEAEIEFTR